MPPFARWTSRCLARSRVWRLGWVGLFAGLRMFFRSRATPTRARIHQVLSEQGSEPGVRGRYRRTVSRKFMILDAGGWTTSGVRQEMQVGPVLQAAQRYIKIRA